MKYPSYFLCCDDGGAACIEAGGNECVCLFTDVEVLRNFFRDKQLEEHGAIGDESAIEVVECSDHDDVLEILESAESPNDGAPFIAIDPIPGKQVRYFAMSEFIEKLVCE
jgi:hypothetical protein